MQDLYSIVVQIQPKKPVLDHADYIYGSHRATEAS